MYIIRFRCASLNTLIIYSSVFYVVIVKVVFKQSNCFNLIAERIACTLLVFCYFLFHLLEKSSFGNYCLQDTKPEKTYQPF